MDTNGKNALHITAESGNYRRLDKLLLSDHLDKRAPLNKFMDVLSAPLNSP